MSLPPSWSQDNRREIDDLFTSLRVARGLRRPAAKEAASADELRALKEEVARLQEGLAALAAIKLERDRAREELDRAKADAKTSADEVAALRTELREALGQLKPLEAVAEMKALLRALADDLASAREEREKAVRENASLAAELARLNAELSVLRMEVAQKPAAPPPPPPAPAAVVKPLPAIRKTELGEEFGAMRDFADGDAA